MFCKGSAEFGSHAAAEIVDKGSVIPTTATATRLRPLLPPAFWPISMRTISPILRRTQMTMT
jgi:hypothetical protein